MNTSGLNLRIQAKLYTPSTLNIQMKLIPLMVWAEWAVFGQSKNSLKIQVRNLNRLTYIPFIVRG